MIADYFLSYSPSTQHDIGRPRHTTRHPRSCLLNVLFDNPPTYMSRPPRGTSSFAPLWLASSYTRCPSFWTTRDYHRCFLWWTWTPFSMGVRLLGYSPCRPWSRPSSRPSRHCPLCAHPTLVSLMLHHPCLADVTYLGLGSSQPSLNYHQRRRKAIRSYLHWKLNGSSRERTIKASRVSAKPKTYAPTSSNLMLRRTQLGWLCGAEQCPLHGRLSRRQRRVYGR